jgi:tetratricopeptide (TPR) repeat protein
VSLISGQNYTIKVVKLARRYEEMNDIHIGSISTGSNSHSAESVPPRLDDALARAEQHMQAGRLPAAEALCNEVLRARSDCAQALNLLGIVAHQKGQLSNAIEFMQRAVAADVSVALYHGNLGEMYRLAGRPQDAITAARRAIELRPDYPEAWSNLGVALYEMTEFREAAGAHRKAIAAKPTFAEAHSNLGNALHALRKFDDAIDAYRHAIELRPDFADAWANLGTTLHHSGRFDDGASALRRAVALAPHHANAHTGLGLLLLMRGDLGEGWDEYEWRLRSTEVKGPRFPETPWQGERLTGKHIYVRAEQGLGDTVQFMRYMPLLAARAGHVTLRVHQELVLLLRESLAGITVLGDRGDPAPYQYDTALLSLPRLFKTRLETIPAIVPYLRAPKDAAQRWKKRLANMAGVKVGVAWAGNPGHINDARRSLDVTLLAPLFAVPGTSFASLQFGPRAADLNKLKKGKTGSHQIENLAPDFSDFSETAGAVSALDLVVTVDTSIAHLAGSMGKPVWLLLPWVADWRWMFNREDNPWYATMRLFRQKKGDAWAEVIKRVATELKAVAQGDMPRLMPFKAAGERRAAEAMAIIDLETARATSPQAAQTSAQTISPGQALMLAEQKRRRGFLADADDLTRQAAAAEPDNAEAAHTLGIIAHQSGKASEAIEHLRRAIAIKPDVALYHANLGEMYRLAGHIDEAIAAGRRAIEIDPNHPGAHSNVGIALFDQGKFEEALAHYDRALALQDDFVQAHSNRGNTLQRLKHFAEAEKAYRRALELQPAFTDAWNNLGTCLRELKRLDEAEAVYRKALELNPNNPETLDNLALAVKELDRFDEAADLMRRALAIEQRSDKYHFHYGTVLLDQHKPEEAAAATERALALNPNNHDAVNLMGRIAFERGKLEAALAHFRRALMLKPDLADAFNNMGNVLKELGHLQEAHQAYIEAIKLNPEVTGVYVNFADSITFAPGDPYLAAMEALAAKTEGLSKTDRMQLDFAFGKAYADLKDYRRSFKHLVVGNAAKRATIAYDEQATFALFDRLEEVFTRGLIAQKSGGGDPSSMPIFVLGMPRSGTTLIEQIIASHPMVHGAGELKTLNDVILSVHGPDGTTLPYPEFVPAIDTEALRQIGSRYVSLVRQLIPSSARPGGMGDVRHITDKMPSNYYFAGLIHLALPNATIIHSMRDPVDTCISCFSKLFSAEQNHTYDLGEIGRYYKHYERLMAHWRNVLPGGRILDVRYEDVVADLGGQARRIIAHCGLPWDDRCLAFHKTDRPVRTASATQVRQPIYKSAVGRWRVYEDHLGPLLAVLRD